MKNNLETRGLRRHSKNNFEDAQTHGQSHTDTNTQA